MSKSSRSNGSALNRRELLRLSTAVGVGAVMPTYGAFADMKGARAEVPAATCATPRSAVATTQYGKVRGYVEDGVLAFKGVPYGAQTGGENRWLPAKAPSPWNGEYPALIYGANCPQRLHDWVAEQTFLYQWTDGWQSEDMLKVMHAYGTNGIITEVEMPLTAAYEWVDVIIGFDAFMNAARYGNALACQDGILTKLITPIAAPVPQLYFKRHQKFFREGQSICVVMVARHGLDAFLAFTRRAGGEIIFNAATATDEDKKGLPPGFELAWNHTTLRALRVDPAITYLQSLYPFPNQLALVEKMDAMFPDEVFSHLEFVRLDGNITCFGLPLVKFTTEARLDEIVRLHEENGCPIFNPHRYTLEEGGMKQTDAVQLAFKRETDPQGLLNPGKMIAWENPDYDYRSGRTFLFKGLQRAG